MSDVCVTTCACGCGMVVSGGKRFIVRHAWPGAEVHHLNGNPADNATTNLVICENRSYHKLLHARQHIVTMGGDPRVHALCAHCRAALPFNCFQSNRYRWNVLSQYCKDCSHERDNRRYAEGKRAK